MIANSITNCSHNYYLLLGEPNQSAAIQLNSDDVDVHTTGE